MDRSRLRPAVRIALVACVAAVGLALAARTSAQDPGAAYALTYAGTLGETGVPWYRSAAQLSGPAGLGAVGDDIWVADGAGKRAIKFSSGGRYLGEIGRAGDVAGLQSDPPVGDLADAAIWYRPTQPPTATPTKGAPTPTPRRPLTGEDDSNLDLASTPHNDTPPPALGEGPGEGPGEGASPQASDAPDALAPAAIAQATPPPGDEIVYLVDRAMHDVIVVDRSSGYRQVLGTSGEAGADDDHLDGPTGVAVDGEGIVYVSDTNNHRVQVYATGGYVLGTIGQTGAPGADAAHLDHPARLAFGPDGLLYIADSGNHRVVALDVSDLSAVKLVRSYGSGRGGGKGELDTPLGVAVDNQFVYAADSANCRVTVFRRLERTQWEDIGTSGACGTDLSPMKHVSDVALDGGGNVYATDPDRHVVWRYTYERQRTLGFGSIDVPYLTDDAHFNAPAGVAVGADGMRYIVEGDGMRLLKLLADNTAAWTVGEPGVADDPATAADDATHIAAPADVAVTAAGVVAVVERGASRVRMFSAADGAVAGVLGGPGAADGQFRAPEGIGAAADGRLAVADTGNRRVQVFDALGKVVMVLRGLNGVDYAAPSDAAFDSAGRIYVSDRVRQFVAVYDPTYNLVGVLGKTNVAGDGFDVFDGPTHVAVGAGDTLFVADSGNDRVQVFDKAGGYLTTIGGASGGGNGAFRTPLGLAIDAGGALLVADRDNHRIQRFTAAAEPWTAGSVNGYGSPDTAGVSALADYNGGLVAGTYDPAAGAAIWRRQAGASAWARVADGGLGSVDTRGVAAFAVHADKLFAGTLNLHLDTPGAFGVPDAYSSAGAALWSSEDGSQWSSVATGGFGDRENAGIGSLLSYGGQLYAGTVGVPGNVDADGDGKRDHSGGGAIYRSASGAAGSWTKVMDPAKLGLDAERAVTAMATMSGTLYAATCREQNKADVVRSSNGQSWVVAGTFDTDNGSGACVTSLQAFDNYLYAAVGGDERLGYGAVSTDIYRCALCDNTDWEQVASAGIADVGNRGRATFAVFDPPPFHFLYVAIGNAEGVQVWRAPDGERWEPVALDGFGDPNNADVYGAGGVAVWSDRLYVGTVNGAHGGELWSTGGGRPSGIPTPPGAGPTPTPRPRVDPPTGRSRYAFVDQWPIPQAVPQDVMGNVIDLEVGADATVYLLDRANNRVMRLDAKGKWLSAFGNTGRGQERIGQAGAMAVDDAQDRIYVSDQASDRLLLYQRDGTFIDAWPNVHAVGIVPLPDGSLWIADRLAGAIRHLKADGTEIERFLSFGSREDDQFRTMADIAVDPGDGTLYVGDLNGQRLRLFRNDGTGWRRTRTVNFLQPQYQGAGCNAQRMIALGPRRILVNRCLFTDEDYTATVPANLTGSDLYGLSLRAANVAAGLFYALGVYDTDRLNRFNETWPAVVRFTDEGFDIVDRFWRGRNPLGAAASGLVAGPVRLSTMPDGNLSLTDANALQVRSPGGVVLDTLGGQSSPADAERFNLQADLTIAQGTDHHVMGYGLYQRVRRNYDGSFRVTYQRPIVAYGKATSRRYCSAFQAPRCQVYPYFEKEWETTLPTELESAAAVAHEPTRDQFLLLARVHTAPYTRGVEQIEYRLFAYPLGFRGKKEIVDLPGEDRDAIWADVDAGPTGRIYVLDTLNDRIQVYDPQLKDLGMVPTPKDAWRVAGGPNNEIYVITVYGHVVRMAADGTVLSRFEGAPHQGVSPISMVDLAVDKSGWVYTVDNLANQVTVFAPEPGTEGDVLQGGTCNLLGDKFADPTDVLLGDKVKIFLTILGTCGFQEQPADIVLAINTMG
ncbi:MAG: NHL repeat-containing protein, partial [Ardenticatenales bacterium]